MKAANTDTGWGPFSATTAVSVDAAGLPVSQAQIGRYAGGSRYKMDARAEALAREALALARTLARPRFGYALHRVVSLDSRGNARLASGHSLVLPPEEQGPGLEGIAAVVCTLGAALDDRIRDQGANGNLAASLFLDAAGVALLEGLSGVCQAHIKGAVEPLGLFCGCPFGPGYGTMPMGSFSDLFRHVEGAAVGVEQAAAAMMAPLKSLAFWLRLTTDRNAAASRDHKCRRCALTSCLYRAAPPDEGADP